jgi:hypothetical protein
LGNEIVTLINGDKPAGTYEVTFDGTELPGEYISINSRLMTSFKQGKWFF